MSKIIDTSLVIHGEFIGAAERDTISVINPSTGQLLWYVPKATEEDMANILTSAEQGFHMWKLFTPQQRSEYLLKAADSLKRDADFIAETIALEVGKPKQQGMKEVIVAIETLQWFAHEGMRVYGRIMAGKHEGSSYSIQKKPVGVVLAISTWNFPIINAARKLGASLAAGCSCIYKADEEAAKSGYFVAHALLEAGIPPGVVNVVFGDPAQISSYFLSSNKVKKLSFTGSIPVGRHLMKLAAETSIRTTMELGGHAPVIISNKAVNLESIAKNAVLAKYRNAGQVCISPTRFLVHQDIFDHFVSLFVSYTKALKVGPGVEASTDMGPLIHERRRAAVHQLVSDAVQNGAELLSGGRYVSGEGFFYEPTVLKNVSKNSEILKEEPFGPVAIFNSYETLNQALEEANRLSVGLAAYGFTESYAEANVLKENLEAGMLAINSFTISRPDTPFLGIKDSGHGAENATEGLDEYLTISSVTETNLI
ncbi:NAD-dependent succinate-semialdehyde dehydrogenase [Acinetobacter baumannii]|uniref:NAD-dependent succinate-semialdehyde dehydrogenase n=1 Tax=Acinetobacter baumannii TaxID=470 RepID=UPI00234098C8|nr:NAD-dependent succinate-semialdehyde dehydrogenase [Acinetobacter baumannii]